MKKVAMWIRQKWRSRLENELREIRTQLYSLDRKVDELMASQQQVKDALDAVAANVAETTTVISGVERVLQNLADEIAALKDAAVNADVPQDIVDRIDALGTAVGDNKTRLAQDVEANTK